MVKKRDKRAIRESLRNVAVIYDFDPPSAPLDSVLERGDLAQLKNLESKLERFLAERQKVEDALELVRAEIANLESS